MPHKLENQVAVITGGNSGIGLAGAHLFAAEGARVAIAGRNPDTLRAAAEAIGNDAIGVVADVSNLADIDRLYATVAEQLGKIDILVVAATIFKGAPLADTTEALYDELMDANLKGAFFTVQKALPYLNDGARIVLFSSAAVATGAATFPIYLASKAAAATLARTFSVELRAQGIRVNLLTPGPVVTSNFHRLGLPPGEEQRVVESLAHTTLLQRTGTAEEIANGLLFLASEDSSFMVGSELVLDGGMSFKAIG